MLQLLVKCDGNNETLLFSLVRGDKDVNEIYKKWCHKHFGIPPDANKRDEWNEYWDNRLSKQLRLAGGDDFATWFAREVLVKKHDFVIIEYDTVPIM